MARGEVDLSELFSEGTNVTLPDGRTLFIPKIGVKTLGEILLVEELLTSGAEETGPEAAKAQITGLGAANDRLASILRRWNADTLAPVAEDGSETEDFAPEILATLISLMATGGTESASSAAEEVRGVLYRPGDAAGASGAEDAAEEETGGDADGAPLRSGKGSSGSSSTSGRSASGRRSGGSGSRKSRGSRSAPTSGK